METNHRRALFLDRDGVVNEESGYVHRIEDVRFVPGIFALCRTARSLDYRIVIVTNQAGIGRGLYTGQNFQTLMDWMQARFADEGASIDAVYHSPYHPEHGIGPYKRNHEDRKPGIGMLKRAAADLGLSLSDSVLVGDRGSDIAAANAAGLRQAFLLTGTEPSCPGDYLAVTSLSEVKQWLTEHELAS